MKLKLWGSVMVWSLLAVGLAHAETPYSVEAVPANRPMEAAPAATTVFACASERALQDTLYWAVQVYDQCVAVENVNCIVPDFPGYPHPSRARMVQLRNEAKRHLSECLESL